MAPSDKSIGNKQVNLILENTSLEGDLTFGNQTVVAGTIKGNIRCADTLIIERGGRIEGRVQAPNIVVHGGLDGTVLATGFLEICTGAVVGGDVSARSVRVDQGAMLTANLAISSDLPDELPPPAPKSTPVASTAPAQPVETPKAPVETRAVAPRSELQASSGMRPVSSFLTAPKNLAS